MTGADVKSVAFVALFRGVILETFADERCEIEVNTIDWDGLTGPRGGGQVVSYKDLSKINYNLVHCG